MRTTRYAAGLVAGGLVAGALLLSGCATIPQQRTDSEADWKPIPNERELAATSERLDTTAVRALTELEAKPLADVFGGPLLRTNRAAVLLADKSDEHEPEPAGHGDPVFHRPTFDDYPIWYLIESSAISPASSASPGDEGDEGDQGEGSRLRPNRTDLTVVQSSGASQQWRRVLRTDVRTAALPELKPVAIPNDDEKQLGRTPASIARAFGDLLLSEKKSREDADMFGEHKLVSRFHRWADSARRYDGDQFNFDLEAKPTLVRTVKTADGGALVLFTILVTENVAMLGDTTFSFPEKDSPVRIQLGQKTFHTFFEKTDEWTVAARVPSKGAKEQRIELLSVRDDFVGAEGR